MDALMSYATYVPILLGNIWEWAIACPPLAFCALAGIVTIVFGIFGGLKGAVHL